MTTPIIEITGLGKKYRIGAHKEPYLSLRVSLVHMQIEMNHGDTEFGNDRRRCRDCRARSARSSPVTSIGKSSQNRTRKGMHHEITEYDIPQKNSSAAGSP